MRSTGTACAILWLNSPNNPTAVAAPLAFYERAAALARAHGFVLACDEAYSELWFSGDAPASALQVADRTNVIVFNTLSKRSSMPGYRLGFAAGDPELDRRAQALPPERRDGAARTFVQRARDPGVERRGARDRDPRALRGQARRPPPRPARTGLEPAGGDASFFLWLRVPGGEDAEGFAVRMLDDLGIVVAPGPFFGPGGEGHVRAALVPTLEECRRAAELLASWA